MPFLTEEEKIRYKKSPFINKFSVESYYNYESKKDYEIISRAREMDVNYDGDNFYERGCSYKFNVYNTLEEALNNHYKRIDLVEFEHLSDEELVVVNKFIENKMHDEEYLARYGLTSDCC